MEQITKQQMLDYYEANLLYDIVTLEDRIIAKVPPTQDEPQKTVYYLT